MKEITIDGDDTFTTLAQKLSEISASLLLEILPEYSSGELVPQEQNHDLATKTSMITKEHGKVNWKEHTAQEIYNRFRAFTPWPGIWTEYNGQVLKILKCKPISNAEAGEDMQNKDIIPCFNNTFLKLEEVQLSGKNKMTMKDFLNGHSDFTPKDLGA